MCDLKNITFVSLKASKLASKWSEKIHVLSSKFDRSRSRSYLRGALEDLSYYVVHWKICLITWCIGRQDRSNKTDLPMHHVIRQRSAEPMLQT